MDHRYQGMGLDLAQGLVLTNAFYWDRDDETCAWSRRFYHRSVCPTWEMPVIIPRRCIYLAAIKAAGTDDAMAVMSKMRELPINDFFAKDGRIRDDAQTDRFGILIYTSTARGQGTLGGLSQMAEFASELLTRATRRLAWCSNDPICAEHSEGSEEYPLKGAACHACLLVPETSCEARNTRLDRGLLTRTVLGDGSLLFG